MCSCQIPTGLYFPLGPCVLQWATVSNRNINPSNQLVSNVSNLHSFGIESDGQLGRDHIENLPLLPFERWLGTPFCCRILSSPSFICMFLADGIYFICDYLIVPHRRARIPGSQQYASLNHQQIIENNLHSEERSVIEHVTMILRPPSYLCLS